MVRGVAGIVTDGGFRDTPTVAALGFPAYHQRPSAPVGPIWHHAADTGLPIACGDVAIYPGDIMVGDGEGVVCVPAGIAAAVAQEAVEATAYEDFVEAQVKQGRRLPASTRRRPRAAPSSSAGAPSRVRAERSYEPVV